MFWDVVKCFHPLWGSYHQSIQWLKWIHKWEVVNLTHRGLCETYPCFLSGLWQTTLERKLADMGVTVIHTQSKRGDRHYCRQTWKSAIRSSTLLLDSLPHTCTKSSVQKKVLNTAGFSLKESFNLQQTGRFWLRKLMFSFQSSLFQAAFVSLSIEKRPKGDVRMLNQNTTKQTP